MTEVRVEHLTIAGEAEAWRALGFVVTDDGQVPLFGTSLRIVEPLGEPVGEPGGGLIGWSISGTQQAGTTGSVDGLGTEFVDAGDPMFADHPIGASTLDHVVVATPDLERTSAAIAETTGCELRRVRDLGKIRQGFHRIGRGGLIVELVEHADAAPGDASFWGLVVIVEDLDGVCARLGTALVSPAKDAVQPGRRIATVREDAGLGLPVALMSPDVPRA